MNKLLELARAHPYATLALVGIALVSCGVGSVVVPSAGVITCGVLIMLLAAILGGDA